MQINSMERLVNTVQELSLATNIDSVMKIVRTVARELSGADGATFVLRDDNMCFYADEDAISPLWKGSRFPMKICISGWVMLNKQPVVIPDIYSDERIPADAYRPTFVKSLAMVPIRTKDPIGAIGNYWANHHLPTEEEVGLLQALADITAVSIENINIRSKLEDKLTEREQMLLQLEKQKAQLEEFTQIISHNLRAPLSNLLLLSDMITSTQEVNDKLRYIEKQKQVVDSLHNTFNELVDAAQVKKDFNIEKEYIDIEDRLLTTMGLLQGEILKSNASITYDLSLAKSIYYPGKYFDSILFNLLSNAIRYSSPERTPIIHIKSLKTDGWTYLEIQDNGLGIDLKQHRNDLFKLHKTFHNHPGAKGFGLFMTRTQVEAMGGTIHVESTIGTGSKFIVQLSKS
ncbi:MAG: GAF domain-containing sensor histidine kinase [Bacteroidales bacterium]|nr:GAF domain-containing sensor histidine kinase [Bacteroidales bacterium]